MQYLPVQFSAFLVGKVFQLFVGKAFHWNCLCLKFPHFFTSISWSFYLEILSNPFSEIFLPAGTLTSNMVHVCSLRCLIMPGRFASIFLSVWTAKPHSTIILFPSITGSGACWYHFLSVVSHNACIVSSVCTWLFTHVFVSILCLGILILSCPQSLCCLYTTYIWD